MYLPAHFEERRADVLHDLVRSHPLGQMITMDSGGALQADSIPFVLDADAGAAGGAGILRGHVARANPVWRATRTDVESLIVFQGPHGYVSPGWYPSKLEHGKAVPTWNYVTVQARGTLRAIQDPEWLRALVTRLTQAHEAGQARPWAVTDAPPDYIDAMLRAIVGIEITLTSLVGKWKVSQNRSAADRDGVVQALRAARESAAAPTLADWVERG
jgi:transcriptional regulator